MRRALLGIAVLALCSAPAVSQPPIDWNAPFPAHRVIDNVYWKCMRWSNS